MANTHVREIESGFYVLRVDDRYTRYFEALWEIPEGITYNAYLLKTSDGAVLFDGWKKPFSSQLIKVLEFLIDPSELKYIVVHHMEPDHTGSIDDVVRWAPHVRVVGHRMAGRMLKAYPRALERFSPVSDGEVLEIGGERIRFIYTPWLHWPETMMSWIENRRILLTCDAFGGYGVFPALFDDECVKWEEAFRAIRKYVVTVIGHYRGWIGKNLDKLLSSDIQPRMIAPGHGLIWRRDPQKIVSFYRELAEAKPRRGKALLVYGSMYGTMEKFSNHLASLLLKKGYRPIVYGFTDSTRPSISEILADAIDSELIIVAAPTYEADIFPLIKYVVEELCWKVSDGKRVMVLSSFGWGGVAGKSLKKMLESCKYEVVDVMEYNAIAPDAVSDEEVDAIIGRLIEVLSGD